MDLKNKMYKRMISCDKATYYSDMGQYKKLSFSEGIKFKAHLMTCKPCRDYNKQNIILSEKIKKISSLNTSETSLSEEKKGIIDDEIKKNI